MDLCGRCLIVVNTTSCVRVKYDGRMEACQHPTDPIALKRWVEHHGQRSGGDCRFEIDATADRLLPISTWQGDPVCSFHLWVLVDAEAKTYSRQRLAVN